MAVALDGGHDALRALDEVLGARFLQLVEVARDAAVECLGDDGERRLADAGNVREGAVGGLRAQRLLVERGNRARGATERLDAVCTRTATFEQEGDAVQHPDDVVGLVVDHGHAGHAAMQEERHGLVGRRLRTHGDHLRARHHHRADELVREVEHRVDEVAVVLLDEVVGRGLVDHAQQLILAGE